MSGDDGGPARGSDGPAIDGSEPRLLSRVLVTWIELSVVGFVGASVGAAVGGPPGFVAYLATTLLSVGVLLYNVNELVRAWVSTATADG